MENRAAAPFTRELTPELRGRCPFAEFTLSEAEGLRAGSQRPMRIGKAGRRGHSPYSEATTGTPPL